MLSWRNIFTCCHEIIYSWIKTINTCCKPKPCLPNIQFLPGSLQQQKQYIFRWTVCLNCSSWEGANWIKKILEILHNFFPYLLNWTIGFYICYQFIIWIQFSQHNCSATTLKNKNKQPFKAKNYRNLSRNTGQKKKKSLWTGIREVELAQFSCHSSEEQLRSSYPTYCQCLTEELNGHATLVFKNC